MTPDIPWLQTLCSAEPHPRPWVTSPFQAGDYAVATNGVLLVAVKGLAAEPSDAGARAVKTFLVPTTALQRIETVPAALLRAWGDPAGRRVPCPDCKGKGGCGFCDGELEVPEPNPGRFLGDLVDRDLVARMFARLDGDAGVYRAKTPKPWAWDAATPFFFDGGDWRAVLMTMSNKADMHEGKTYQTIGEDRVNPAWLAWNDGCVRKMAIAIRDERRWGDLPLLHDALIDAGCEDAIFLEHCRDFPHDKTNSFCWVIDALCAAAKEKRRLQFEALKKEFLEGEPPDAH